MVSPKRIIPPNRESHCGHYICKMSRNMSRIPPINVLCNSLSNVLSYHPVLAKSSEWRSVKICDTVINNRDHNMVDSEDQKYPPLLLHVSLCVRRKRVTVSTVLLIFVPPSLTVIRASHLSSTLSVVCVCLQRINHQSLPRHTYKNLSARWKENPGCLCACEHALLAFVPRNWCAHTHHLSVSLRLLNRDSIRKFPCSAFFCAGLPRSAPPPCLSLRGLLFCLQPGQ